MDGKAPKALALMMSSALITGRSAGRGEGEGNIVGEGTATIAVVNSEVKAQCDMDAARAGRETCGVIEALQRCGPDADWAKLRCGRQLLSLSSRRIRRSGLGFEAAPSHRAMPRSRMPAKRRYSDKCPML